MNAMRNRIRTVGAGLACAAVMMLAGSAQAYSSLNLIGIDTSDFASIAGAMESTMTQSYDFIPQISGGDGQVTSTVYQGIGAANGLFIYTFTIELFDTSVASIGAVVGMTFHFGSYPADVSGIGMAFFVDDGSGNKGPDLAVYDVASETAAFRIAPSLNNGETSLTFGLFSQNAPAPAVANLIDSGAQGGDTTVLSNGAAVPVPEPSAPIVFALGMVVVAAHCRKRARA